MGQQLHSICPGSADHVQHLCVRQGAVAPVFLLPLIGPPQPSGTSLGRSIKSVEQSEQTDCEFYMNLCNTYGLAMKVYAQKIVVYDREAYKKKGAAAVLSPSNMKSWSWQQDQAGTYTGGEFTYTSPATEKEIKVTVGKGSRILKQSGKADSKADAERKIKAAVAKANHGKTKLSATIVGNASLVASQCVQVVGLGKLSGKYYIDTITHNVSGSGGYTMDLEMSLVEE